jgi:hypothetical protein
MHAEQQGQETMDYRQSDVEMDIGGMSDNEQGLQAETDLDHACQLLQIDFDSDSEANSDEDVLDGFEDQVSSLLAHLRIV